MAVDSVAFEFELLMQRVSTHGYTSTIIIKFESYLNESAHTTTTMSALSMKSKKSKKTGDGEQQTAILKGKLPMRDAKGNALGHCETMRRSINALVRRCDVNNANSKSFVYCYEEK